MLVLQIQKLFKIKTNFKKTSLSVAKRTFFKQLTEIGRSRWRADGIGSSFVLELLPSPSSRKCDVAVDVARTEAPQLVQVVGIFDAKLALSSSKYKQSSFNSKLSRINSCCLSSNWRSLFWNTKMMVVRIGGSEKSNGELWEFYLISRNLLSHHTGRVSSKTLPFTC